MDKDKLKITGYYVGIACGIIFVTAFLVSQIIMPLFFGRAKTVEVPNVVNMSTLQAKTLLTDHKLHAVVKDSIYSEEVPGGKIISQKPESGNLIKPDGTVYLIASKGSKSVSIPEVIGLNVQAAWILLKNASLKITVADSLYSDLYPVNTVVRTEPGVGARVERKSKIKLYISKGSNSRTYPDTTGADVDYNY